MHRLGVLDTVVNKVLNHTMPGVRGIYNRWTYFPEKREALEKWAGFLGSLVGEIDNAVRMPETFEQLDELLVTLGASVGRS